MEGLVLLGALVGIWVVYVGGMGEGGTLDGDEADTRSPYDSRPEAFRSLFILRPHIHSSIQTSDRPRLIAAAWHLQDGRKGAGPHGGAAEAGGSGGGGGGQAAARLGEDGRHGLSSWLELIGRFGEGACLWYWLGIQGLSGRCPLCAFCVCVLW